MVFFTGLLPFFQNQPQSFCLTVLRDSEQESIANLCGTEVYPKRKIAIDFWIGFGIAIAHPYSPNPFTTSSQE
jgi:hypothetical protein